MHILYHVDTMEYFSASEPSLSITAGRDIREYMYAIVWDVCMTLVDTFPNPSTLNPADRLVAMSC